MRSEELQRHYDEKYQSEASRHGTTVIKPVARPGDRFAAAVSTLTGLLPSGAQVLELGAGDGLIADSLLRQRDDIKFTVTDSSQHRIAGLRQRFEGQPRADVRLLDAEGPLDLQVDVVVLVALIEHFVDPLHTMLRVRKTLRSGGFVYIDTPNIAKWTRRIKLGLGRFPSTASRDEGLATYDGRPVDLHDEGHLHYFTFRSLELMLVERCGFARVERHPYWLGPVPRMGTLLAAMRPTLFSELAISAHV